MIFDQIEFHNVEELEKTEKGYKMWRLPKAIREQLNEDLRTRIAGFATGVELRFKVMGEEADIFLCADEAQEAQVAYIYYGSVQGGWQHSAKVISTTGSRIHISRPENLDVLQCITDEHNLAYSPSVVRIVLPYCGCYFVRVEGEVAPPLVEETPGQTYLAYGSSITHGSLALSPCYTYPFRIAQKLNCDYLNFGFAGSAHLEACMAEYLVSRKDWHFASVEMGINMLGDNFDFELFEQRVDNFTKILSRDDRPIFATNLFGFNGQAQQKAQKYREIVKKYAMDRLIFTDGLELLNDARYISQDLTHPSLEGIQQISNRWGMIMKVFLKAI